MTERLALMVTARLVEAARSVWTEPGIAKPLEIPDGERSWAVVLVSAETFSELLAASGWRKLDGDK